MCLTLCQQYITIELFEVNSIEKRIEIRYTAVCLVFDLVI